MKKGFLFALLSTVVLVSCKKEGCTDPTALNYDENAKKDNNSCTYDNPLLEPVTTTEYLTLDTAYTSQNEMVILYADDSLTAGYTNLYAKVMDSNGDVMSNATVTFNPMMDMGMMQHSAPIIQPSYSASTETYDGVVVFQMSSMGGTWTVDVNVNSNPAAFTVNIAEPSTKEVGVYTGDDGVNYIVSLVRPVTWVTGSQDLNIMIHKKETMMNFPAVTDLDVTFTPEMMSMGHGSAGNIDPVHISDGLYSGTVNFNMAGDWRFHLELNRAGTLVHADAFLDILF